ncbi:hypothetical protein B0H11DRAFT_2188280 [Mycena galericulata]|nr:hypothetical protein B0H11DRAFT_2188280 [Mycena galericulata]
MSRANRNRGKRNKKTPAPSAAQSHSFSLDSLFPGASLTAESAPMQSFVERPSVDGQRLHREIIEVEPPSPVKCARLHAAQSSAAGSSTAPAFDVFGGEGAFPHEFESERYTMMDDAADDPPLPDLPPCPDPKAFKPAVSTPPIVTEVATRQNGHCLAMNLASLYPALYQLATT